MSWIKYPALAGLMLLLTGCVTNLAKPLSNDAAPSQKNGVIAASIVSLSATGVAFVLHNDQTNVEYALSLGEGPGKLENVTRKVIATEVPPGEYQIKQWETFQTFAKAIYTKSDVTNASLSAPFTVQAGQVIYLGDFLVQGVQRYGFRSYSMNWQIVPEPLTFNGAHSLFTGAFPAYAHNEFSCRLCQVMRRVHVADTKNGVHFQQGNVLWP
jgi:hypothetical protein